jgi:glutathione synthase/RimK-type ligase-like ATP-grasp enzyme
MRCGVPRLGVVGCRAFPTIDDDWPVLAAALAAAGVEADLVWWDDAAVEWGRFDAAVLRGTWDSTDRPAEFLEWTRTVGMATILLNSVGAVEWCLDKRYLAELGRAGIPIVPTRWVPPGETWEPPAGEFVVKPTISGGGTSTARYDAEHLEAASLHVASLHGVGATVMVQPYQATVDDAGETALIYIGSEFSHAVRKSALLELGAGVVSQLWEREEITPTVARTDQSDVAATALQVATAKTGELAYARVDLVDGADGEPQVLEVELIDPSLFLQHDVNAPTRLAKVLARALNHST